MTDEQRCTQDWYHSAWVKPWAEMSPHERNLLVINAHKKAVVNFYRWKASGQRELAFTWTERAPSVRQRLGQAVNRFIRSALGR